MSDEFIIPRWLFAITECRLKAKKVIHIRLTRGTELWFAENDQLDVFATGSTTQEAVEEFVLLIIHYFKHYRLLTSSNALAEALRLKQLYESSFTEVTQ